MLAYIIHAADSIALMSVDEIGIDTTMYKVDNRVLEFLKLDRSSIEALIKEASAYAEITLGAS